MTLWNVAGALHDQNGIIRKSYNLLVVTNAVFSLEAALVESAKEGDLLH